VSRLDRFFEISARKSTVAAEFRGGIVTFIAMAYIIVLNPIILSSAPDVTGNRLEFTQVSAMTSLAAGVMTILFGAIARLVEATINEWIRSGNLAPLTSADDAISVDHNARNKAAALLPQIALKAS